MSLDIRASSIGYTEYARDNSVIKYLHLLIFEQYQPEKGAKFLFVHLDHNVAGGMSPNNGENRDSKKELHLCDKDLSRRLATDQPFKPILTSVPRLALDQRSVKSLIFF